MSEKYNQQLAEWREREQEIHRKKEAGGSYNELAKEYGVSVTRIQSIVKRARGRNPAPAN